MLLGGDLHARPITSASKALKDPNGSHSDENSVRGCPTLVPQQITCMRVTIPLQEVLSLLGSWFQAAVQGGPGLLQ